MLGGDSAIPPPPRIAACATSLDHQQALQVVVPAGGDERVVRLQHLFLTRIAHHGAPRA